jgi:hypothetical protein
MKRLLHIIAILAALNISAQVDYVPFDQVKQIADQNAQSMWGDVFEAEPMAYYSENDELLGYRFTYSFNVHFPDKATLDQRCREAYNQDDRKSQWGIEEYGTIFVSARKDMGVIQNFTKALPPHHAFGFMLQDIALEKIGGNISLHKAYYIDFQNQWFCYTNGSKEIYIKLFPKVTAVEKSEFQEIIKPLYFFNGVGNFDEEWDSFLNQGIQAGKAEVWIPNHDGHCKFYDWSYGCSPTAAAMLLSYWDFVSLHNTLNYSKLVDHHFHRWDGIQGEWDYQVPNVNKELAIAMETDTVSSGGTERINIAPGYASVCNSTNGYSFTCTNHDHGSDFVWYFNKIVSEIGTYSRPVHISIPGHSECCVAYDAATNLIGVHNTWWEGVEWINRSQLERVYTIVPGGSTGLAVELTHPMGDIIYNHNGSGETFYAGSVYEIRWDRTVSTDSYVWLRYSINGGHTWSTITSNTPNDGKYDWVVPAGINSSSCRIKASVYNSSGVFSGADGSIGNFKIYTGGSLPVLSEDVAVTTTTIPAYYQFTNTAGYWSAVGVRADDWDIELHNNTSFNNVIASSVYGGSAVDFVVIDGNHSTSIARGIKAFQYSGSSSVRIEFEGGADIITPGTPLSTSWPANDVVEIYDVYLTPGKYGFILDITSGTANLDFALYGSSGSAYYEGKNAYLAMSGTGGAGADEYFTYTVTTADRYGLCLWANDANSANYTIKAEPAGTWTGLVSTNWNNANNWSINTIPDATINVTIPSGTLYQPYIYTAIANCNSITINTGATLTVGGYALNAAGNLTVNGTLASNNTSGEINVQGNVVWNSGSTANFTTAAPFKVHGNWNFESGSNANLANGVVMFMGAADMYISSYSTTSSFNHVGSYKTDGYKMGVSYFSSQPLNINGYIYVHPGAIFGIYSTHDVVLKGDINSNGTFLCNYGKVVLDGVNQNLRMNTGDYFNNLTFSQTGTVTINNSLSSIIDVNANVVIESGIFNMQDRTMKVGGTWTNSAGSANFNEGTGRVVFDGGNYHQYCSTETFNILEVNKPDGGAFRVNGGTVSCAQYDWTAGAVDVLSGIFTANDLADNGLYGAYYVNPGGEINLTNSGTGTWIDLIGEIYNYGGVINLTGSEALWPYSNNAKLTMSSGVIDFKTCGISIPSGYSWTHNITGGTIKTSGYLSGNCSSFTPTAGTFEFYGSSDVTISQSNGCTLRNVIINKGTAREGDYVFDGPVFDQRSGVKLSDGGKSNTITLNSDFIITGDLDIDEGTFNLGIYSCNVSGTTNINATLKMNNASNDLTTYSLKWNAGSNADVTAGMFHVNSWDFNSGADAQIGTGNTAYVKDMYYPDEPSAHFGNLVVIPFSKLIEKEERSMVPVNVAGNLTVQNDAAWNFPGPSGINVSGNADIQSGGALNFYLGGVFNVQGILTIGGELSLQTTANALIHGGILFPAGGELEITDNASLIADHAYISNWTPFSGTLTMNSGLFELTYNHLSMGMTATTNMTGGIIRTGGSFAAYSGGTFQPVGGVVELAGNTTGSSTVACYNGNYFHNLTINRPGQAISQASNDWIVKNDLTIQNGSLRLHHEGGDLYIGGDWINNIGSTAFNHSSNAVIFNGAGTLNHQYVFGNTNFYDVRNAKTGTGFLAFMGNIGITNDFLANGENIVDGTSLDVNNLLLSSGSLELTLAGPTVTVNNFTMGGTLMLSEGNFSCNDITNNGIFGTIELANGNITLNQSASQFTDLNGTIIIYEGTLTVNGSNGASVWGFGMPASLSMFGGILDFNTPGIIIENTYAFSSAISGGTIRTAGSFSVNHPNFIPTGGTAELYSSQLAVVRSMGGSHFYNLTIDKSSGSMQVSDAPVQEHYKLVENRTSEASRPKLELPVNKAGSYAFTTGSLKVNNNTIIEEGNLETIHDVVNAGNLTVNSGGVLSVEGIGSLAIGSGKALTVTNGGTLNVLGDIVESPKITRISGNYGLNIESGATIRAEYAIFEHMNTSGVNVKSGAIVDPSKSFTACVFRNGQGGGRLLTLNNNQSVLMSNVVFPGSTGNYNISKTVDAGVVVLSGYSGSFGGPLYEQDSYGRIHWTGELTPNVTLDGILIGSGQDLCFEALQTITLGGSQSFIVENGGNVNLVAGQNIRLLAGTHVHHGAYLHAWITYRWHLLRRGRINACCE